MKILKKVNNGIVFVLLFGMYLSFVFQFESEAVSYGVGLLILAEIIVFCVEQGREEDKKVDEFIHYARILYSLDFSKLKNVKDIIINHDKSFTIVLQVGLSFTYTIACLPTSQEELVAWDLQFDSLRVKEN